MAEEAALEAEAEARRAAEAEAEAEEQLAAEVAALEARLAAATLGGDAPAAPARPPPSPQKKAAGGSKKPPKASPQAKGAIAVKVPTGGRVDVPGESPRASAAAPGKAASPKGKGGKKAKGSGEPKSSAYAHGAASLVHEHGAAGLDAYETTRDGWIGDARLVDSNGIHYEALMPTHGSILLNLMASLHEEDGRVCQEWWRRRRRQLGVQL